MPRLAVIWADGAYTAVIDWVREAFGWVLTTILRPVGAKGYVHLPRRWIVERTFGWFGRYRRLSKDYETNPRSSETWIYIAMIHRMARGCYRTAATRTGCGDDRNAEKSEFKTPSKQAGTFYVKDRKESAAENRR